MKSSKIPFLLFWFDYLGPPTELGLSRTVWTRTIDQGNKIEPNLRKNFKSASVTISPNKSNKVRPIVLDAKRVPENIICVVCSEQWTVLTFVTTGTYSITNIIIWKYLSSFDCSIKLFMNVQSYSNHPRPDVVKTNDRQRSFRISEHFLLIFVWYFSARHTSILTMMKCPFS